MDAIYKVIPKDKFDLVSLKFLDELDVEQVKLILPRLMEWLQDINWPVARELSKSLPKYGIVLLPYIKSVLSSGDTQWQFSVMCSLIRELSRDVSVQLEEDLLRIALTPTKSELLEELHIFAKETLDYIKAH